MHRWFHGRSASFFLAVLTLLGAGLWPAGDSLGQREQPNPATRNRIDGITKLKYDQSSGTMAVYALQSCFETQDFNFSYSRLAGISGMVFKFVYDTTEAYEPLRDLYPVDLLQTAAVEMGFEDAYWDTDRSADEIMGLIKREIDEGRPVVAPNLQPDAYVGLFIITGYDLDTQHLLVQGATPGPGYDSIPVAGGWNGPTASPAGWATNPVFLLGRQARGSGDARAGRHASIVALGIEVMKGGELEYGKHPGEQPYLGEAGLHTASYGVKALELLSHDIAYRPLVKVEDGKPELDFGFLWRIDSQIRQLQHDRLQGYSFMRQLRTGLAIEWHAMLEEVGSNFQAVSKDAESLRGIFLQAIPEDISTADSALAWARESPAMALILMPGASVIDGLRARGENLFDTPWGLVLVDDTPEKRMAARLLVRAMLSRERNSIRMLEELLPYVDSRVEHDRPEEQRRPWKGQQGGQRGGQQGDPPAGQQVSE